MESTALFQALTSLEFWATKVLSMRQNTAKRGPGPNDFLTILIYIYFQLLSGKFGRPQGGDSGPKSAHFFTQREVNYPFCHLLAQTEAAARFALTTLPAPVLDPAPKLGVFLEVISPLTFRFFFTSGAEGGVSCFFLAMRCPLH